jgi:hypothetical protein
MDDIKMHFTGVRYDSTDWIYTPHGRNQVRPEDSNMHSVP